MPADEDYSSRQISQQQHTSSVPNSQPGNAQCAPNCLCSPADRYGGIVVDGTIPDDAVRYPNRFGSERSQSDRLPSGERYQGVSERYPLGERPQTSISSDRLQAERYQYQRYPDRFNPVGSLDRYHPNAERYSRTNTPTDRFNTFSSDKGRYTPTERYHTLSTEPCGERFHEDTNGSDRFTTGNDNFTSSDRYTPTERHRTNSKAETFKTRERSNSGERRERYPNRFETFDGRFHQTERFPTIPCPERFASQERVSFSQVSYMEPPSPAPASDRFIPPPLLSPENAPSTPDCFTNNAFPSPTTAVPPPDRFISPPPLTNSPTEAFSPKKLDRRYPYSTSPNPSDRYLKEQRLKERGQMYLAGAYHQAPNPDRDRYIQNPHMPVDRYVPQPQPENYYAVGYHQYDRFSFAASDPYMRRDLAAFHYRFPVQYPQNQYQRVRYVGTPNRIKCCQFGDSYQLSKSSPGSSSSSSVTSQSKDAPCVNNVSLQDIQCQNYQQEKGVQCSNVCQQQQQQQQLGSKECLGFVLPNSANVRISKGQCRHSICSSPSVEYVGASGGRHVCATPPPRNNMAPQETLLCNDNCCIRRSQNSLTVAVWRSTPTQQQQQTPQPPQSMQPSPSNDQTPRASTPITNNTTPAMDQPSESTEASPTQETVTPPPSPPVLRSQQPPPPSHTRAISLPATSSSPQRERRPHGGSRVQYTQSERAPRKPNLGRSMSKKEVIKNYIKRETATFFGVDEGNEKEQQEKWLERRKRMASRRYGPLKEEYRTLSPRTHRRVVSEMAPRSMSGQLMADRPDVLPGPSDVPDTQERLRGPSTLRRKDSVARMTWDGLSYVVNTLTSHRSRPRSQQATWSRSYPPEDVSPRISDATAPEEVKFFDQPAGVSPPPTSPRILEAGDVLDQGAIQESQPPAYRERTSFKPPVQRGWQRPPGKARHPTSDGVGGSRISSKFLDNLLDNSNRRQFGMGWFGKVFGRSIRRSVTEDEIIQEQLDDLEDHRPMFTYWVTIVQVLVLFISLICYGFGPFGIDLKSRSGQVLVTSLSLQQVDYMEPANFWLGPRAADLIHLGAKFAPCMRIDDKIGQEIEKIRTIERETACCIRNDDSGCVQSSKADCSETISTWNKWSEKNVGPGGRISGSVCGLDPKFCDAPASVAPYKWPDDITKWPICRKIRKKGGRDKLNEHMVCEIIGHPCCIGIHGKCKITTKEYCDFVQGTFHEEASLCSQVSCLNDVCGMLPFYFPETPDQFYRLWTSLFLHAGVLQLAITLVIQYFLMRDLEKLTGSLRIGIIYIGSGMAGNLASAIFVPYRADVGPAGSQFGLLACLIVEVLNAWPMLKHPTKALCKLLAITSFLFLVGLLPWVDNYAHLFGFVFGFLLSYALLPFISFGKYDRSKKVVLIWVCLLSAGVLFISLVLLFYIIPVYDCKICSYFNCIPLTGSFCASQNINFKREEPIV